MYEVDHRYLKFVDFTQFEKWDVKRHYHKSNVEFSNEVVLLGNILKPYKKGINKEYIINNKLNIISKINFGGELFLRDFEEINTYKGNLFLVPENSIIYSKINVRHGCIYYHQKNETPFAVSNEYPIYTFDEKRIDGRFIQKLIRSNYFKNLLNTKTSGISKARVKQDEFLDIQIPLPNITEQKAILDDYQQKIENAKQQETKAQILEQSIEKYLFEELGIVEDSISNGFGLKIIEYKSLERWDGKSSSSFNSKFSTVKVSELIKKISTGTTPPTNIKEYFEGDINFYAPSDLGKEMYLFNAERNISQKAIDDKKARVFEKNTLLFVGIGSTVGKIGIIGNDYATSNQQITGLNFNNRIFVEYAYYYFNYFTSVTIKEKTQATIPIVNQDKILNIPIPLPPLEKQKEIAEHISAIKDNIKSLKQNAETLKAEAEKEFEEKIFN